MIFRSSHRRLSIKIPQHSLKNICVRVSATLLKRDSNTGVNIAKFLKTPFNNTYFEENLETAAFGFCKNEKLEKNVSNFV